MPTTCSTKSCVVPLGNVTCFSGKNSARHSRKSDLVKKWKRDTIVTFTWWKMNASIICTISSDSPCGFVYSKLAREHKRGAHAIWDTRKYIPLCACCIQPCILRGRACASLPFGSPSENEVLLEKMDRVVHWCEMHSPNLFLIVNHLCSLSLPFDAEMIEFE